MSELYLPREQEEDHRPSFLLRSAYYALEPQGRGTPQVESLSSYCARLAFSHNISYGDFLATELKRFHRGTSKWQINSTYLNDALESTQAWVTSLQESTKRSNLSLHTFLPLMFILNPTRLLRKTPAWCPTCLVEQQQRGEIVYEHLLWAVAMVKVCSIHQTLLATHCPSCHSAFSLVTKEKLPGYCSLCRSWLGGRGESLTVAHVAQLDLHTLIASTLGELVGFISAQPRSLSLETVRTNLKTIIHAVSGGRMKTARHLSKAWNFRGETIKIVCGAKRRMTIQTYTTLIAQCGLTAVNLLDDHFPEEIRFPVIRPLSSRTTYKLSASNIAEMELALQQAIETHFVIPLATLAQMLHISINALVKHFPKECEVIRKRGKRSTNKLGSYTNDLAGIINKTSTQDGTGKMPLPALMIHHRKREKHTFGNHQLEHLAEFEQRLQTILTSNEFPFPSLNNIVQKLESSRKFLQKHFPEQVKKIAVRYLQDKHDWLQQKFERKCEKLFQCMLIVHQNGEYPSIKKLRNISDRRIGQWVYGELEVFYKKKLVELGYKR